MWHTVGDETTCRISKIQNHIILVFWIIIGKCVLCFWKTWKPNYHNLISFSLKETKKKSNDIMIRIKGYCNLIKLILFFFLVLFFFKCFTFMVWVSNKIKIYIHKMIIYWAFFCINFMGKMRSCLNILT